jgi:O-antigen/teichoic acid export membrane protein
MVGAGILRAVLRGVQRYDYFVRLNLMTAPLWVAGCILAVLRGGGIAAVLGVGFLVQLVIVGALASWAHREVGLQWRARLPQPLRSRVLRYGVMLAALVVLNGIVWKRSELLFLGRFHGPEQMAFYAVPFAIAERLSLLLPGALLGVLLPGLTYAYGAADPERFSAMFSQALQYLAMLTLPICLLGISLAPGLIRLVYGPRFGGAIAVLQILLIAMAFGVLGQAASAALLGMERQGWLLKTGAAAAVVSIALNLLLIPPYGAVGAAVANTLTQAGWALAAFLPLRARVLPSSRLAILQAAGAAAVVAALLAVTLLLQVTPLTLALSGAVALMVYAFALERMHLFSPRMVIQRLRPNA